MSKQEGEAGRLVDYAVVQEPRLGRMERPELLGLAQRVIEESDPTKAEFGHAAPGDVVALKAPYSGMGVVIAYPTLRDGVQLRALVVPSTRPGGVPPLMFRDGPGEEEGDTDESDYFDDEAQAQEARLDTLLELVPVPAPPEPTVRIRGASARAAREEVRQMVDDCLRIAEARVPGWLPDLRVLKQALAAGPGSTAPAPAPAASLTSPAPLTIAESPVVVGSLLDDDAGWWDESEPIQVYVPPTPEVPTVVASFTIPKDRWKELEKMLAKVIAKGEKQGIRINVETQPGVPFYHKDDVDEVDPIDTLIVTVTEPERPEVKGWALLAVVEHGRDDDGRPVNVIMRDPTSPYKVPVKYRNEESYCDHCKTRRRRNQTWLLVKTANAQAGQPIEIVRVGSNCLKDYVEPVSARALLSIYDLYTEVQGVVRRASDWTEEERGLPGRRGYAYETYLMFVAASIAEDGWHPRWIKEDGRRVRNPVRPTAESAWIEMVEAMPQIPKKVEAYRDEANAAVQWARQIPHDTQDDYLGNLRGSVYMGSVQPRLLGILASLIPAYRRSSEPKAQGAEVQPHEHFLKVGDKFNATFGKKSSTAQAGPRSAVVTFTSDRGYSGMTELYAEPGDGHPGAYFWLWENLAKQDMPVGTRVTVSGKVKEHSVYQGKKRTTLHYAKVKPA